VIGLVEFKSRRTGGIVRMRITQMNTKTIDGQEISRHDNTDTFGKWRVDANALTLVN
jgi:hypothetical protein